MALMDEEERAVAESICEELYDRDDLAIQAGLAALRFHREPFKTGNVLRAVLRTGTGRGPEDTTDYEVTVTVRRVRR